MKRFEVIVIGGGIAGLGVADEAGARGLSTLVLEARTCCSQTSDNTLRIIHGGFRYLQTFDIPRVIKSLRDQTDLLREVPNALAPLPCLMPLSRFSLKSKIPVACAGWIYQAFMKGAGSPLPPPLTLSSRETELRAPFLRGRAPHGALCWHDVMMVTPGLVKEYLVARCVERGVVVEENRPVVSIAKVGDIFEVRDQNGSVWRAPRVVNTMGPWIGTLNMPSELRGPRPSWCRGINLIISRQIDALYGITLQSPEGRLFFCVPRGQGTAIGTWYEKHSEDSLPPQVSEGDITTFLQEVNATLGGVGIDRSEVVGVDIGVLPDASPAAFNATPRAHEKITNRDSYIEVLSTKYTTFRSQARAVLELL
jgi:glycerol-3-phosphate dehydrogenase